MAPHRTDDLAAWLLEQIAEDADRDRRVARLARAMYESFQGHNPYPWDEQRKDVRTEYLDAAEIIVDREMPSVLAECDAKRELIRLAQAQLEAAHLYPGERWAGSNARAEGILRILALPYADREEWRPDAPIGS